MECERLFDPIKNIFTKLHQETEPNKTMTDKAFKLVECIYTNCLRGTFSQNNKLKKYMYDINERTSLQNRILLAKAVADLESDTGFIMPKCKYLGKGQQLVSVHTSCQDKGSMLEMILNTDHPAFHYKTTKEGDIPISAADGFEIVCALVRAQEIIMDDPHTLFIPRNSS